MRPDRESTRLPPTTLTARSPEDLLAVAPVVLGFTPDDSLVMLTFGPGRQFHARVDLPRGPRAVAEVGRVLLEPVLRHGVGTVALLAYTGDDRSARRAVRRVCRELRRCGVTVVEALRAHEGRWFPLLTDPADPLARRGSAFDVSGHPFLAHAVLQGHVLHDSRRELAATVAPDPAAVAEVLAAGDPVVADAAWVTGVLDTHVARGTRPDAAEAARLLSSLAEDVAVRDAAWTRFRPSSIREEVELWADLLRRAPDRWVAATAAVLAMACWVAGQGALGWCAVDRALEGCKEETLALRVAELLTAAAPPDDWDRVRRGLRSA